MALTSIQPDARFQDSVLETDLMTATNTPGTPGAGSFYSSVIGRKPMVDFRKDLKPRMGIERYMVQQVQQLQDEVGPNNENIFGAVNDIYGQLRFIGNWGSSVNVHGQHAITASTTTNEAVEITFYGTGLNILMFSDSGSRDHRAQIDGGVEGANFYVVSSGLTTGGNVNPNQIQNVATGLSLGVHTVRIRNASAANDMRFYGYEVLTESTQIITNPGYAQIASKKTYTAIQNLTAYNSSFESGTLGARGGRVVVYQKKDGTIAKAVQPVNAAQANMALADHTNEEVARTYFFREFGVNKADDFSNITGTGQTKAYVLDDNTTELIGGGIQTGVNATGKEGLLISDGIGNSLTFTFVGTGLDIYLDTLGLSDAVTVQVDGGASIGTINTANLAARPFKIVSGLPYGTHVVRLARTNATVGNNLRISSYIVYQPKKPSIPVGAIELADYNIMATYVANIAAGLDTTATGVLRKSSLREALYVNGTGGSVNWQIAFGVGGFGYYQAISNRQNAYVQYTFFGTGFEFRFDTGNNRSANITTTINGLLATTANFPSMVSSVYGAGASFAAGILDQLDGAGAAGSGLSISGLPLGTYTVRFNNNTASSYIIANAIDVITPIHSHKANIYADVNNTLPVGSCAISDNRKTSAIANANAQPKAWVQAVAVQSAPTTTSTSMVPCPDMSLTIKTNGNPLEISYRLDTTHSAGGDATFSQAYVDGVAVGTAIGVTAATSGYGQSSSDGIIVPVTAGVHKVDLYWSTSAGTTTGITTRRNIKAREI